MSERRRNGATRRVGDVRCKENHVREWWVYLAQGLAMRTEVSNLEETEGVREVGNEEKVGRLVIDACERERERERGGGRGSQDTDDEEERK